MSQGSTTFIGKRPLAVLQKAINKEVRVKLKNALEYKGLLVNIDSYMNVLLDEAFEYKDNGEVSAKLGRIVIRGNNILYVVLSDENVI